MNSNEIINIFFFFSIGSKNWFRVRTFKYLWIQFNIISSTFSWMKAFNHLDYFVDGTVLEMRNWFDAFFHDESSIINEREVQLNFTVEKKFIYDKLKACSYSFSSWKRRFFFSCDALTRRLVSLDTKNNSPEKFTCILSVDFFFRHFWLTSLD